MEDPDTVLLEMAAAPTPQPPATSAAPAPAASAATAPSAAVMVGQPIETIGAPRRGEPIPPPRGGQAASAGSAGRGRPARISRQPIVFDLRDTIQ